MKQLINIFLLLTLPIVVVLLSLWYHYDSNSLFDEDQEFFVVHENYQDFKMDLDSLISGGSFSGPINTLTLDLFLSKKRLKYWFHRGSVHGRYVFPEKTTINDMINKLRVGDRDPVNVIFNSSNNNLDVFGVVSKQLAVDSIDFINYVDTSEINLDLLCLIPETYNMYWNISVDGFLKKMEQEYNSFWNKERVWLAGQIDLKPFQVMVLASIVEKEARHTDEMKTIAGVYLNRLNGLTKFGKMKLQADPTINYCRVKSGKIRKNRIKERHINEEFDCLHNTYSHYGLPPSPICVPSTQAIDAVLEAEKHQFIYFCAKPDFTGYHNFAKNLRQHNKNAKRYHNWCNKMGIN